MAPPEALANLVVWLCPVKPDLESGRTVLVFLPGQADIWATYSALATHDSVAWKLLKTGETLRPDQQIGYRLFVLHSVIPLEDQREATRSAPEKGIVHVILATSIAESSLTIPCVTYVVD